MSRRGGAVRYSRLSTISSSANSRTLVRASTTVTRVLSAVAIDVNSSPITPAPTTMMWRGMSRRPRRPSTSRMRSLSIGTCGDAAGS